MELIALTIVLLRLGLLVGNGLAFSGQCPEPKETENVHHRLKNRETAHFSVKSRK